MQYLVKRTYQYTTEEWVEAESESDAESSVATDEEERNHDDAWHDSEVIGTRWRENSNEALQSLTNPNEQ